MPAMTASVSSSESMGPVGSRSSGMGAREERAASVGGEGVLVWILGGNKGGEGGEGVNRVGVGLLGCSLERVG